MNLTNLTVPTYGAYNECMTSSGALSDSCVYKMLCPQMSAYYHNAALMLLITAFVIFVFYVLFTRFGHKIPVFSVLNHKFDYTVEINRVRLVKNVFYYYMSACVMLFVVMLYFS